MRYIYLFCLLFISSNVPTILLAQTAQNYFDLAIQEGSKGDNKQCLYYLNKTIKADKKFKNAYGFRAMIKFNSKRYNGAVADMDTCISLGNADLARLQ